MNNWIAFVHAQTLCVLQKRHGNRVGSSHSWLRKQFRMRAIKFTLKINPNTGWVGVRWDSICFCRITVPNEPVYKCSKPIVRSHVDIICHQTRAVRHSFSKIEKYRKKWENVQKWNERWTTLLDKHKRCRCEIVCYVCWLFIPFAWRCLPHKNSTHSDACLLFSKSISVIGFTQAN